MRTKILGLELAFELNTFPTRGTNTRIVLHSGYRRRDHSAMLTVDLHTVKLC